MVQKGLKRNIEANIKDVKIEDIEQGDISEYKNSEGENRIQFTFKISSGSCARLRLGLRKLAPENKRLSLNYVLTTHEDKTVDLSQSKVNAWFEHVLK